MDEPIGVLLLGLGGPDSLDAVRPFLMNLFSDRDIVRLPGGRLGQWLIARMIVRPRLAAVRRNYVSIGGRSPLLDLTLRQAAALERALSARAGRSVMVAPAMRYWHPFTGEALADMAAAGVRRIVALTLYPHYSLATTGSSVRELLRVIAREFPGRFELTIIDRWPTLSGYLDALAARIEQTLGAVPEDRRADVVLLFSAHGLPVDFIRRGDPYADEIDATIRGLMERVNAPTAGRAPLPWRLAYQSRVGPAKWLGPSTADTLRDLAAAGHRDVIVVPVSFITDHVETLHEIDQELAQLARALGFVTFRRTEALNDEPAFIDALASLVCEHLGSAEAASGTSCHPSG